MSQPRLPPPDPAPCLGRAYSSSQKGGTLIAEEVTDLETHRRRLSCPDGYRPAECRSCRHAVLHAHDHRDRVLRASADPVVTIAIYLCTGCRATWRILPLFVARHLWRSWQVVEAATVAAVSPSAPAVPERTVRRWTERLASSARRLVQLLATSGSALLESVVHAIGIDATRTDLIAAYSAAIPRTSGTSVLANLAAHVHRLSPGARLV